MIKYKTRYSQRPANHWKPSRHLRLKMCKTFLMKALLSLSFPPIRGNPVMLFRSHTPHPIYHQILPLCLRNAPPISPHLAPPGAAALVYAIVHPPRECFSHLTTEAPAFALAAPRSGQNDPPLLTQVTSWRPSSQNTTVASHLLSMEPKPKQAPCPDKTRPHPFWPDRLTLSTSHSTLQPQWPCSFSNTPGTIPPTDLFPECPFFWNSAWLFPHLPQVFTQMWHGH